MKDKIRARGLLDDWKPGLESQQPIHNSRTTTEGTEKNNLPVFIWKNSTRSAEAQKVISKAFAFRGIELEEIPPNMRLNEHRGKRSIVCAMQHPLETKAAEEPEAVHMTLLNKEGQKVRTQYHGPKKGLAVLLYNEENRLVIGEGLETTLSAIQATGTAAWSAEMRAIWRAWRSCPNGSGKIFILVDSDTTRLHRTTGGIDGSGEHGSRQTTGASVFLVTPDDSCFTDQPLKKDFNDLSRRSKYRSGFTELSRYQANWLKN